MPKLSIIAVTYGHTQAQIDSFINSFLSQINEDWEMLICHDGPNEELKNKIANYKDGRIKWIEFPIRRGFWGHPMRKDALNLVTSPWIHWTNMDNTYCPRFVDIMLSEAENNLVDIQGCWIAHNYGCQSPESGEPMVPYSILRTKFHLNRIDWCGFIMKTDLAKKVGLNHIEFSGQDGMLVQEAVQWENAKTNTYPGILVIHN